ncbi:MAG: DNA mismatch repair protein MutS, partial [Syntrophomonadaceae bacterium]|nr:DNA mismatch repair protein MutS [Syntrophomonadaceae bacterium]
MVKQTPMMQQYMRIRQQYPDALLMYRMGDFYEFFFDDAITAARDLEIVLTSRSRDTQGEPVPMCGVPWHSVNSYISRLISKGHHVAVCEQVEDPKLSTGIVKREVVRLLTPGTVLEDFLLDENVNNYLAAICDYGNRLGWSYLDVSTGAFYVSEFSGDDREAVLEREVRRVSPAECLVSPQYCDRALWQDSGPHMHCVDNFPEPQQAASILCEQFSCDDLNEFAVGDRLAAISAAAAIILYLRQTQKSGFSHINTIQMLEPQAYLELDSFTRSNLELTQSLRGKSKQGTVLAVIDHCCNAMGRRRLRTWLERPLTDRTAIDYRLDAVEELVAEQVMRNQLLHDLKQLYDMERIIGRLGSKAASPRDLLALKNSLDLLPEVLNNMASCKAPMLRAIAAMDTMPDLRLMIEESIDDNAPLNPNDGGVIRSGYHPEVDELRSLSSEGSRWLMAYEAAEREATGIKSLKVSYNKVFGYYIDVTKSNVAAVPPHYIRKQTLVNNERFITVELKEYEDKIMRSTERLKELENKLFIELRDRLEPYSPALMQTARLVADLDCLLSLAVCAYLNDYCRPTFATDGSIDILAGRHPVIELSLTDIRFVPNDLHMAMKGNRFAIITGPNMGGKSTFMRQVALICLLAQMG